VSRERNEDLRIAIVRMTAMGDIIHTLASMQFIKRLLPGSHISWFVEEKFAPVLENSPDVDRIVPLNLHGLKKDFSFSGLFQMLKRVKDAGPFDRVIDVQGLLKSAIVARAAGKEIYGLDASSAREPVASFFYKKKHRVDCAGIAPVRFASLVSQSLDIEIDEEMLLHKDPYIFFDMDASYSRLEHFFSKKKKNIIIITAASNMSKTYPPERFSELIDLLEEYNVLLVAGSAEERENAAKISQRSDATLLPELSLNELKYAIERCDLLVGGDTGPSHMAWALNKPSVILFGSTPKSMMMETRINKAVTSGADVHPCRFDKNDRSISTIAPQEIKNQIQRIMQQ